MQEEVRMRSHNWLSCDIDPSDPHTWICPPNWHCDWQGPWEFERLRRLATLLLARAPGYRVRFDVIVPGYVKVDVLHDGHIVGEVYVRKGESDGGVFCVSLGAQEEHQVRTEAEAVRLLTESGTVAAGNGKASTKAPSPSVQQVGGFMYRGEPEKTRSTV
jgi:hypothetical protein